MDKELIDFRKKFGLRIGQLLTQQNVSQQELAANMNGRDKQAINRYIKQGANPSAFIVLKIAEVLKVNVNDLYDFSKIDIK